MNVFSDRTYWGRVSHYFVEAFGKRAGVYYAVLGGGLFVATTVLAFVARHHADGSQSDWYLAVAITTIMTGVSAAIDFRLEEGPLTPVTIGLGSFALLVSQSLWAEDRSDGIRLALFLVQLAAVAIQLGAISNTPGREPLQYNRVAT